MLGAATEKVHLPRSSLVLEQKAVFVLLFLLSFDKQVIRSVIRLLIIFNMFMFTH